MKHTLLIILRRLYHIIGTHIVHAGALEILVSVRGPYTYLVAQLNTSVLYILVCMRVRMRLYTSVYKRDNIRPIHISLI